MRRLAALGLTMLATIMAAGAVTGTARADTAVIGGPPSCAVIYNIGAAYTGGFIAEIGVTFSGFPARLGWQVSFDFVSPDQHIISAPNEQWFQSGEHVLIENQWQTLPSNGSLVLGFVGSAGATNPPPVNFTFDGVACTTGAIGLV